jgi:serine/threonine protein kinase
MKKPSSFGKYLLLERLNVGGMAEVFVAKAFGVEGFERILAIKKILPTMAEDEEFITMFIDEARISVQLNHTNVVHIHELGKHEDAYYIAMEYVPGKDLRALLERFRRRKEIMPTAMAVYCGTKVCEGLDYAHRKKDPRGVDLGIIHRDVSPQNILISYDGDVKIIDFGIAKAANRSQKTQAGILKGKFGYMSPEQVRGLPVDRRSDIFAVGVVLYEMLTGEKLFVGESDFSTLEKVRNADVPTLRQFNPSVPAGLEKVVLKALAREVEDRYQWASDLQEDLMRFLLAGDAIYSGKHLTLFMKSAFAEDLLRENEKMERFSTIGRPDQGETSDVYSLPSRRSGGASTPSASFPPFSGSAPKLNGRQSPDATVNIDDRQSLDIPPTAEELAEMDGARDQTMIVDGLSQDSTQARHVAPTASVSDDPAEAPGDQTLPPLFSLSSLGEESGSHDLRPIEMTGFRSIADVERPEGFDRADANASPRPGRPQIIVGDAPVGGATSIAPSPYAKDPPQGEDSVSAENQSTTGEIEAHGPRSIGEPSSPRAKAIRSESNISSGDSKRTGLLLAIGVVGLIVLGAVGVLVSKFMGTPSSSVLVGANVPFKLLINPGQMRIEKPKGPIQLAPGEYTFEFESLAPGYRTLQKTVTVRAGRGEPMPVMVTLAKEEVPPPVTPSPKVWTLVVAANEGAEILLDNQLRGTSTASISDLEMDRTYEITAKKAGFETLVVSLKNEGKLEKVEKILSLTPKETGKPIERKPKPEAPKPEPKPKLQGESSSPKVKAFGRAVFGSVPLGADLWIDGKKTGRTTPVTQSNPLDLTVGHHRAVFKFNGKSSAPYEFDITEAHKQAPLVIKGNVD